MALKNGSSVLVVFGERLPKKNQKWWSQFDKVLAPSKFKEKIERKNLQFFNIEELIDPGSIQEAYHLLEKISYLTLSNGKRLSKLITYQGYELWWIHYSDLNRFCLDFLRYRRLLEYLKHFPKIFLYQVSSPHLFQYFLNSFNCQCINLNQKKRIKKLFPIPLGILFQTILSIPFLLWLKIRNPKLMVWTSDQFESPHDYDFRMKYIYEELRKRKISFVEFIRSQEHFFSVCEHALKRKRPVVYSGAIISFLHYLGHYFGRKKEKELVKLCLSGESDSEKKFWLLVAIHYLRNSKGTIFSIEAIRLILQWIDIKVAIIPGPSSRTFHELLACKLNGIKTLGIQHGCPQYYLVSDFLPGFNGGLFLSPDIYGLWSKWWKEYYLSHSQAFKPEQLFVSGHMRPLIKEIVFSEIKKEGGPIKVLFVSEQLAVPSEVIPYLLKLQEVEDFDLYIKFRPYRDGFEGWLERNRPEILKKVKILRGNMHQAIAQCEVAVGCHSTGVLEALLQLKPAIFFYTKKWGDYFELKSFDPKYCFFAKSPEELIDCIRKSREIPREVLEKLRDRFFGNPYQNGSKWVVDQAEKRL